MRKLIIAVASIAALAVPTAAMAGTGTQYGNSGAPGASGNGTQVSHHNVSYTDPILGPVNCIGVEQVKKGKPTQDSFTCTSTSGSPLTNQSPGQPLTLLGYPWASDANASLPTTYNINGTVSADGMSYSAVATY